jgi:hypothetical protein
MKTRNENTDIEIEDITLIGSGDLTVPRAIESITMEGDQPRLSDIRIEVIKRKYSGAFKRSVFVGVMAKHGRGFGLGIATEHDRGYWPLPGYWFSISDFGAAMDYAMELNLEVFGISEENAQVVIGSTMRHGGE